MVTYLKLLQFKIKFQLTKFCVLLLKHLNELIQHDMRIDIILSSNFVVIHL